MTVYVKFFAGLRDLLPKEPVPYPLELPEGARVGAVLQRFGVPEDKPRILLVNGRHADLDRALAEGDQVSLFPPVAGG